MVQTSQTPAEPALTPQRRWCAVRFEPSGESVRVPHGTSLLEAARRAGLPVASACDRHAACGRCGLRVLAGAPRVERESARETELKARNRVDAELRLSCLLKVRGDLTVTATYW